MDFKVRLLDENDYDILTGWWKWFRFPIPERDYLPEDGKGGVMIMKNGINICAGFLFLNNSKIAWLEYIVSNPEYRENDREIAIQEAIKSLCYVAQKRGYKAIFTSLKHQNLIKHYEKVGFTKGSTSTTEMIIRL